MLELYGLVLEEWHLVDDSLRSELYHLVTQGRWQLLDHKLLLVQRVHILEIILKEPLDSER